MQAWTIEEHQECSREITFCSYGMSYLIDEFHT